MSSNAEQPAEKVTLSGVAGVTESVIDGIGVISPVTQSNFDAVIAGLHQRGALRKLTEAETNTPMSSVMPGTYFFAYGFQLTTSGDSTDFLVSRTRGTDWHHFELHKQSNHETVLLGFTTRKDYEKFDYYSKTYGPTPQLVPRPLDDFNVLLILPLRMLGKIINQDLQLGVGGVTALEASLRPKE